MTSSTRSVSKGRERSEGPVNRGITKTLEQESTHMEKKLALLRDMIQLEEQQHAARKADGKSTNWKSASTAKPLRRGYIDDHVSLVAQSRTKAGGIGASKLVGRAGAAASSTMSGIVPSGGAVQKPVSSAPKRMATRNSAAASGSAASAPIAKQNASKVTSVEAGSAASAGGVSPEKNELHDFVASLYHAPKVRPLNPGAEVEDAPSRDTINAHGSDSVTSIKGGQVAEQDVSSVTNTSKARQLKPSRIPGPPGSLQSSNSDTPSKAALGAGGGRAPVRSRAGSQSTSAAGSAATSATSIDAPAVMTSDELRAFMRDRERKPMMPDGHGDHEVDNSSNVSPASRSRAFSGQSSHGSQQNHESVSPVRQASSNLAAALDRQKAELAEVQEILAELALTRYQTVFEENGFDSREVMLEMTEEHMQELGMALGHRIKLRKWIHATRPGGAPDQGGTPGVMSPAKTLRPPPGVVIGGTTVNNQPRMVAAAGAQAGASRSEENNGGVVSIANKQPGAPKGILKNKDDSGATTSFASNSLLDGEYDEAAEAAAFKEAVMAWRMQGKADEQSSAARTQSQSSEAVGTATSWSPTSKNSFLSSSTGTARQQAEGGSLASYGSATLQFDNMFAKADSLGGGASPKNEITLESGGGVLSPLAKQVGRGRDGLVVLRKCCYSCFMQFYDGEGIILQTGINDNSNEPPKEVCSAACEQAERQKEIRKQEIAERRRKQIEDMQAQQRAREDEKARLLEGAPLATADREKAMLLDDTTATSETHTNTQNDEVDIDTPSPFFTRTSDAEQKNSKSSEGGATASSLLSTSPTTTALVATAAGASTEQNTSIRMISAAGVTTVIEAYPAERDDYRQGGPVPDGQLRVIGNSSSDRASRSPVKRHADGVKVIWEKPPENEVGETSSAPEKLGATPAQLGSAEGTTSPVKQNRTAASTSATGAPMGFVSARLPMQITSLRPPAAPKSSDAAPSSSSFSTNGATPSKASPAKRTSISPDKTTSGDLVSAGAALTTGGGCEDMDLCSGNSSARSRKDDAGDRTRPVHDDVGDHDSQDRLHDRRDVPDKDYAHRNDADEDIDFAATVTSDFEFAAAAVATAAGPRRISTNNAKPQSPGQRGSGAARSSRCAGGGSVRNAGPSTLLSRNNKQPDYLKDSSMTSQCSSPTKADREDDKSMIQKYQGMDAVSILDQNLVLKVSDEEEEGSRVEERKGKQHYSHSTESAASFFERLREDAELQDFSAGLSMAASLYETEK
ncbi:unnamed protein product [Amoebophrya sp. A25]|nr:unnamed protein product [Amoebophrya sp. A25]|eukprot:GSA25T00006121001.1